MTKTRRMRFAVWGENMNVHDCTFSSTSMSSGKPGPNVACELHGAHNYFRNVSTFQLISSCCAFVRWHSGRTDLCRCARRARLQNSVLNYSQGLWCSGNQTTPVRHQIITGNSFVVCHTESASLGLSRVRNDISLSQAPTDSIQLPSQNAMCGSHASQLVRRLCP